MGLRLFGAGGPVGSLGRVVVPAVGLLLPLNWLAAALAGDRGVVTRVPLTLAFVVSLQALAVLLVATGVPDGSVPGRPGALQTLVQGAALWNPLPWALPVRLPFFGALCAVVGMGWLLLRAARDDSPMDAGLAVGLGAAMACCISRPSSPGRRPWRPGRPWPAPHPPGAGLLPHGLSWTN